MWPWEHLAVGYVLFTLLARAFGRPVDGASALAVAFGTQFPDLVDKPLAWSFAVLPSGTTLAHSLLVAVPVAALVVAVGRRRGRATVGAAFAVGYLSHLPADLLYGLLTEGGPVSVGALLWPLVEQTPSGSEGLFATVLYYVSEYRAFLATPRAVGYLLFEGALLGLAFALWIADGTPGVGVVRTATARWRSA
jgi:hypothetical protein